MDDIVKGIEDSLEAFLKESAERQGKTPEQMEADDRAFWQETINGNV